MEIKVIDNIAVSPVANKYDTLVKGEILITGLTTSVTYPPTLQATRTDIELNSNLVGYGGESESNYGNLFVRPSQWLHILDVQEAAAKQYLKPISFQTNTADINTKIIGVANNFTVAVSEDFITKNEFDRVFTEGGLDELFFAEDYLELFGLDYVESLKFIYFTDERYIDLNKPFSELINTASVNTKLIETDKRELVTSSEVVDKVYEKSVLELVTASDDFYGLANLDDDQTALVIKAVLENVVVSQVFSSVINTVYSDTTITAETNAKTIESLKLENIQAAEQLATLIDFKRQFSDTVLSSDDFLGTANLDDDQYVDFVKVISSQALATEQTSISTSSVLSTQLISSTELHSSYLDKVFNELINATDDFFGNANVDDDQIALVIKAVVNSIITSEVTQYVADFKRLLVDVPVISDPIAVNTEKVASTDYLQNVTDVARLHPNKGIIEESFFFDRYVREDFVDDNRPNSTDDYKTFELSVNYSDISSINTSLFIFSTSKILASQVTNLDQYRATLTIPKFEQSTISDSKLIVIEKGVIEQTTISELFKSTFDKNVPNTVNLSEARAISFEKPLESLVSTTDDFYGLANADDDQTALILKVVNDTLTISDLFDAVYTPSTPVEDSSLLLDERASSFTKVRQDSFVNTDDKYFLNEKILESEVDTTTEQKFNIQAVLVDAADWFAYDYLDQTYTLGGVVLYEQLGKHIESVRADTLTGTYETDPVFYAYKTLESQFVVLEVASFELSFHLADYLIATDDFYGLANLDDDQIASFSKVLHETPSVVVDLARYSVAKVLSSQAYAVSQELAKNVSKVLLDLVQTTDDFYGLANLDDDQVASVGKVIGSTLLATSDIAYFVTDTYRLFSDTSIIGQEVKIFTVSKDFGYSEAVVTEQQSFSSIKPRQDAFSPIDQASTNVAKVFVDNNTYVSAGYSESVYAVTGPFVVEDLVLHIQPGKVETTSLSETYLAFASEILKQDIPLATELASKQLLFNLLDNFSTTDDFYGLANLDDDQIATVLKVVNESVLVGQELVVFAPVKALNETPVLVEIQSFNLQSVIVDSFSLPEQLKFGSSKVLSSSLVSTDVLELLLVQGRSFFDNVNQSDTTLLLLNKSPNYEQVGLTETNFTKFLAKSVLNTVTTNSEVLFRDISTVLVDAADWFAYDYLDESYTLGGAVTYDEASYSLITVVAPDTISGVYNSIPVFEIVPGLVCTGIATDILSRVVNYNTSYADFVYPTDDFLGAANLDDDQYVLFVKVAAETTNTQDNKYFNVLKARNDTSTVGSEVVTASTSKVATDTTSTIDEKTTQILKSLNTTLVSTDILIALLVQGRTFIESVAISQNFTLNVNPAKFEQITAQNDLQVFIYDKTSQEIITTSEELERDYDLIPNASDFFLETYSSGYTRGGAAVAEFAYKLINKPIPTAEAVTISDTRSYLIQKYKPEQSTATETLFILTTQSQKLETINAAELVQRIIAKAKTESAISSEQATALLENYFPSQFAQAGYVGTNFTL